VADQAGSNKRSNGGDAPAGRVRNVWQIVRWGFRGVLVCLCVANAVIAIVGGWGGPAGHVEGTASVVIDEGPRYGEALVRFGAEKDPSDAAIRKAIDAARGRIVVEIAPGVPQRDVDRILRAAAPAGGLVYLRLAESARVPAASMPAQ
jgi:hypothetical protein